MVVVVYSIICSFYICIFVVVYNGVYMHVSDPIFFFRIHVPALAFTIFVIRAFSESRPVYPIMLAVFPVRFYSRTLVWT